MIASLTFVDAQKFPAVDKSPMDASLWRTEGNAPVNAKVVYSRPMKNDREIWGALVPYDKLWRLGANETTEITFTGDVNFGGTDVKAGTYALYAIPGEKEWTLILNSKLHTWGHYQYDESMDVARVTGIVGENASPVEAFSIIFENQDDGSTHLVMGWDTKHARVPIK